jgi:hypothetical protein
VRTYLTSEARAGVNEAVSWCERQRPPSDETREDVPCARRDGHARVHRVAAEEDRVAGRHLHAIREALSMQLGRWHRDGMLRVAVERAACNLGGTQHAIREEAPRWDAPRGRRACRPL